MAPLPWQKVESGRSTLVNAPFEQRGRDAPFVLVHRLGEAPDRNVKDVEHHSSADFVDLTKAVYVGRAFNSTRLERRPSHCPRPFEL